MDFPMAKDKIQSAKSRISGKGAFAKEDISKGETICVMSGELMDLSEMIARVDKDLEEGSDPLGVDHEMYIDLDELPRSINHSCSPNAFISGNLKSIKLIALRDIKSGEEIFWDYSTTMDDQIPRGLQWTMKCKCGSKNCRKKIDQFKRLPLETQKYYIENKFAPDFILRKFS
jgi:uncharacterized protein